jgi:hypothetical protein
MARRMTVTYTNKPVGTSSSSASYYLATNTDVMKFYLFDEPKAEVGAACSLIDQLDRSRLLGAGDKATAKEWAKRLGLKSWTYVRV